MLPKLGNKPTASCSENLLRCGFDLGHKRVSDSIPLGCPKRRAGFVATGKGHRTTWIPNPLGFFGCLTSLLSLLPSLTSFPTSASLDFLLCFFVGSETCTSFKGLLLFSLLCFAWFLGGSRFLHLPFAFSLALTTSTFAFTLSFGFLTSIIRLAIRQSIVITISSSIELALIWSCWRPQDLGDA